LIKKSVETILKEIGENPSREGLLDTPKRFERAVKDLTSGYGVDVEKLISSAVFHEDYDEMVFVKDIQFYSLCEHHMLPFFGKCHVAYIPDGKIVGLSKIPRLVDAFARRLQVQERLTEQVAGTISEYISPKGVGVVIEARHMCMEMRGVEKFNSHTITSSMAGSFKSDKRTRSEFLKLIGFSSDI